MSEIPPLNSAALLKRYGLHAEKRLSQNFLQDPIALEQILQAAGVEPADTVLEIGAGLGALTRYLARAASRVEAVELDRKLIPALKNVLQPYPNIHITVGDILRLSPRQLELPAGYLVVANIPYRITSAIVRHLLEADPRPREIILTLQKEVARRICATPPEMSILALSVQVYGQPEIAAYIPAHAFFPVPKVDSAVVKIHLYSTPRLTASLLERFFRLIKAGFGQKRKTLRNALAAGLHLAPARVESMLLQAGIDPGRRAETLDLEEWSELCRIEAAGTPAS